MFVKHIFPVFPNYNTKSRMRLMTINYIPWAAEFSRVQVMACRDNESPPTTNQLILSLRYECRNNFVKEK